MFKEKSTEEIIDLINDKQLEEQAAAINKAVDNAFKGLEQKVGIDKSFKQDQQGFNVQTGHFDMNIKNDEININAKKKDNHTLTDLEEKLINYLYSKDSYAAIDVEIMKILFGKKEEN